MLATMTQKQAGFIYLSAWIFARLVNQLNMYPGIYKARIMRGKSGNIRANMFIYKIAGEGDHKNAVVYNEEGDVGSYNRANRSVGHFLENSTPVIFSIIMCGFVYAMPTMVLIIIFSIGRMLHQIGYSVKGYGGHGVGFALSAISAEILYGLLIVVAAKSFEWAPTAPAASE